MQIFINAGKSSLLFQNNRLHLLNSTLPLLPVHSSMVCILAAGRLTLGGATSAPGISPHGNSLDVSLDILKVLDGALKLPAVDGLGGLAGVLEGHTEVGATGAGGLGVVDVGGSVTDLIYMLILSACAGHERVSRTILSVLLDRWATGERKKDWHLSAKSNVEGTNDDCGGLCVEMCLGGAF